MTNTTTQVDLARSRPAYQPHLDGLRALAVYLVVVFHAGADRLEGGFIGVDVFFVLSGYLVTGLLIRDLDGPDARVDLARFYSRRARRLLPAAAVNLVVTAAVFAIVAAPIEFADARNAIRAAALYFANWHFIRQSADYFATDVNLNPVQHYWSLSVEEQFYFLWPLLLSGLYRIARKAGRLKITVLRVTILAAGLASLLVALSMSTTTNLNRAYYGTDTRSYQLLAGAALALSPQLVERLRRSGVASALPIVSIGLLGALAGLATSLVRVNAIQRGALATVCTVALLVVVGASERGPAHRLLCLPAIAYLGRISYGTYLWHWLIIVVLVREFDLSPIVMALIAIVLGTAVAALSYHLVEQPIRLAPLLDRLRPMTIATGLGTSLLVGLLVAPQIFRIGEGSSSPDSSAAASADGLNELIAPGAEPTSQQVLNALQETYDYGTCQVSGPVACPISAGTGKTAIVVGESHAGMLTPLLSKLAKRHDVKLFAGYLDYCPWPSGIQYTWVGANCFNDQADQYDRIIPELDPDIVFFAHRPVDDVNSSVPLTDRDEGHLERDSQRQAAALDRRISQLVKSLRNDGRTVVMFEPIPVVDEDENTLTCLSKTGSSKDCQFKTRSGPGAEEKVMRKLAADDSKIVSLDLDRLVCPNLPTCDPVVNGLIVKRDDNHLTTTFALSLADPVDDILTKQGVW